MLDHSYGVVVLCVMKDNVFALKFNHMAIIRTSTSSGSSLRRKKFWSMCAAVELTFGLFNIIY